MGTSGVHGARAELVHRRPWTRVACTGAPVGPPREQPHGGPCHHDLDPRAHPRRNLGLAGIASPHHVGVRPAGAGVGRRASRDRPGRTPRGPHPVYRPGPGGLRGHRRRHPGDRHRAPGDGAPIDLPTGRCPRPPRPGRWIRGTDRPACRVPFRAGHPRGRALLRTVPAPRGSPRRRLRGPAHRAATTAGHPQTCPHPR
jgi:hypothetical protein